MSRASAVRQILAELLRSQQSSGEPVRVKLLLTQVVLEGTLDLARNNKLLATSSNGVSYPGDDGAAVYLTDVAIRPLSEPEVHVGLNELQLFLEAVNGIISPL